MFVVAKISRQKIYFRFNSIRVLRERDKSQKITILYARLSHRSTIWVIFARGILNLFTLLTLLFLSNSVNNTILTVDLFDSSAVGIVSRSFKSERLLHNSPESVLTFDSRLWQGRVYVLSGQAQPAGNILTEKCSVLNIIFDAMTSSRRARHRAKMTFCIPGARSPVIIYLRGQQQQLKVSDV